MSSVVSQNFMLATTILILDLDEDLVTPLQGTPEVVNHTGLRLDRAAPSRQEIIAVLQDIHEIWSKASKRSNEARKVAAAIRLVLRKANLGGGQLVNDLHSKLSMHLSGESIDTLQQRMMPQSSLSLPHRHPRLISTTWLRIFRVPMAFQLRTTASPIHSCWTTCLWIGTILWIHSAGYVAFRLERTLLTSCHCQAGLPANFEMPYGQFSQ